MVVWILIADICAEHTEI